MARKMSKAEKAQNYDQVRSERDLMHLVFYDQMKGITPLRVDCREPAEHGEHVGMHADLYRPTGADGGIVVLQTWTIDADGDDVGHTVQVTTIDTMNLQRLPSFYMTALGRAHAEITRRLMDMRREAMVKSTVKA